MVERSPVILNATQSPGTIIAAARENTSGSFSFTHASFDAVKLPGEFSRAVEAELFADAVKSLLPELHGPAVAPDDAGPQDLARLVQEDEPVHLVGDSDRLHRVEGRARRGLQLGGGGGHVFPPDRGILLSPARPGAAIASSVFGLVASPAARPVAPSISAAFIEELPTSKPRR